MGPWGGKVGWFVGDSVDARACLIGSHNVVGAENRNNAHPLTSCRFRSACL